MTLEDTSFAFVDIETTGGNAVHDRVIEIAVIVMEGNKITRKWSTLVNPERSLSHMITMITGLTGKDLVDAPTFSEVAQELLQILEGKVFVAHNARFDYGFIKNEFRRLEIAWSAKTLCTVRLSRALYPKFRSHSLDAVIERFGFPCENRHRALDDSKVCTDFWYRAQDERGLEQFEWAIEKLLKRPSLPSHLPAKSIDAAPEGTGIYIFYGKGKKPIYIGKSVDLRSRVLQHFSSDHQLRKDMEISQRVRHVEYRETVGELGALLLESQLIKQHLPLYNIKLRKLSTQCAIKISEGDDGFETVEYVRADAITPQEFDSLYGIFRGESQAKERMIELAEAYSLCSKILKLETVRSGSCFGYHLKKCKGACTEEETALEHNLRLRMALSAFKHKSWPFKGKIGIKESRVFSEKAEIHLIDQWCYLGTYGTEEELQEALEGEFELNFNLDNYRIISSFLKQFTSGKKKRGEWKIEIIQFPTKKSDQRISRKYAEVI